jgi:hypothetical protein
MATVSTLVALSWVKGVGRNEAKRYISWPLGRNDLA